MLTISTDRAITGRTRASAILLWLFSACSAETPPTVVSDRAEIASPTGPGAMAPFLTTDGDDLLLTWLERVDGADGEAAKHRLYFARGDGRSWSTPVVVAEGDGFFANWADVPAVVSASDGTLFAHWLAKTGEDTYAYSIELARSNDGGLTWQPIGQLNDDATQTEHGFVSFAPDGDGVRAVWLDGREMADGGAMTLRTAVVSDEIGAREVLDARVCECCPTDLVASASGFVVFYRDRGPDELRNIGVVTGREGRWETTTLAQDGWKIPGCPVNGPAADSRKGRVAVAWFTAGGDDPRVLLAVSDEGDGKFSLPVRIDDGRPLGRVDLAFSGAGVVTSWLELLGESAEVRVRLLGEDGRLGPSTTVLTTGASRASGIPRIEIVEDRLYVAAVVAGEDGPERVELHSLSLGSLGP